MNVLKHTHLAIVDLLRNLHPNSLGQLSVVTTPGHLVELWSPTRSVVDGLEHQALGFALAMHACIIHCLTDAGPKQLPETMLPVLVREDGIHDRGGIVCELLLCAGPSWQAAPGHDIGEAAMPHAAAAARMWSASESPSPRHRTHRSAAPPWMEFARALACACDPWWQETVDPQSNELAEDKREKRGWWRLRTPPAGDVRLKLLLACLGAHALPLRTQGNNVVPQRAQTQRPPSQACT